MVTMVVAVVTLRKEGEEEGNENLMEGEGGEQPKPASKSSGEKYFE